jgi:hypothetical protein
VTNWDGSSEAVTGAMTLTADGLVSVTSPTMSSTEQATIRCVMDAKKSLVVCTSTKAAGGEAILYLYTKRDKEYPAADLLGVWNLSSLTAPASAWRRGMILFDATGSVTASLKRSDGTAESFTDSYSFSSADGILTFGSNPTRRCAMDSARRILACTGNSGSSDAELFVMTTTAAPVAGGCGSSNGASLTAPPTDNLCANGSTPTAVSVTEPWTWYCQGAHGGSTSKCTASRVISEYTLSVAFGTPDPPVLPGGGMVLLNPPPAAGEAICHPPDLCKRTYPYGTSVVLTAYPDGNSSVVWSGDCNGETCGVNMATGRAVLATFSFIQPALIVGNPKYYTSLQAAYNDALSGQTIKTRQYTFVENLTLDQAKGVTIKGGFDTKYNTQIGYSLLQGKLTMEKGALITELLELK